MSNSPVCPGSMGPWRTNDSIGSLPKQCPFCGALEEILVPDRRFAGFGRVPVHAPNRDALLLGAIADSAFGKYD